MASDKVREAAEHVARAIKILGDSYGKGRAEVESNARCACFDAKYALDAALDAPSGGDATRDEAVVAWAGFNRHGTLIDLDPDKETVEKCVASESTYYPQHGPYRVVALVPQQGGAR